MLDLKKMNQKERINPRKHWFSKGFFPGSVYMAVWELNSLLKYHNKTLSFVKNEVKEFEEQVDNYVKENQLEGEQKDQFYDSKVDEHDMLESFFPISLQYSVIVLACTLFESPITNICKMLDSSPEVSNETKWIKCSGTVFEKAKNFLKQNFEINIGTHPSWNNLSDYFKIRHCIAHANGEIGLMKNPTDIKRIIKKHSKDGLSESELQKISVNNDFIKTLVGNMTTFYNDLNTAFINNYYLGPRYWP